MTLGMSTATYTLIHVIISVIGIGSGLVVLWGMIRGKQLHGITAIFLASTILTSVTGFGFHADHLLPSHKVGILSLVLLGIAVIARYPLHLAGKWRPTYVITAMISLYLNVFVLVIQSFEKAPSLRALAPTQSESPFVAVQITVLAIFIVLTVLAVRKFRVAPSAA